MKTQLTELTIADLVAIANLMNNNVQMAQHMIQQKNIQTDWGKVLNEAKHNLNAVSNELQKRIDAIEFPEIKTNKNGFDA